MDDLDYWQRKLREAEAALEAARTRTKVDAAAKRLQLVNAELKRLEAKRPSGLVDRPVEGRGDIPKPIGAFLRAIGRAVRKRRETVPA